MSTATSTVRPVLVAGQWRDADYQTTFQATDPNKNESLAAEFPVSSWEDCDAALDAAVEAARELRRLPAEKIAEFLERYADRIEAAKDSLVEAAFAETGLGKSPRLADVELPRTSNQLRAAAAACGIFLFLLPSALDGTPAGSQQRRTAALLPDTSPALPFAAELPSKRTFAKRASAPMSR